MSRYFSLKENNVYIQFVYWHLLGVPRISSEGGRQQASRLVGWGEDLEFPEDQMGGLGREAGGS